MKVLVYIIPTSRPVNTKALKNFFKSNNFFKLETTPFLKNPVAIGDFSREANAIYSALSDSKKKSKNSCVITILDTSVSTSDSSILEKLIKQIYPCKPDSDSCCGSSCEHCIYDIEMEKYRKDLKEWETDTDTDTDTECYSSEYRKHYKKHYKKWDVAYLANWQDRCDLYKPLDKKCKKSLIEWVRTFSPNGTQALLWSPRGRDIVLGKKCMKNGEYFPPLISSLSNQLNRNIEEKNLIALTTTPLFFFFDVNLAITTFDLLKMCQCREIESEETTSPTSFTIFVVLTTIVIAFAWLCYTMWGKYK